MNRRHHTVVDTARGPIGVTYDHDDVLDTFTIQLSGELLRTGDVLSVAEILAKLPHYEGSGL